ncbi:MAG: hypothetical protein WC799_16825 [Desulfobacteraceae bacterium]|jgi:hypothetical protein
MREEENKNETPACSPGCGCNEKPNKGRGTSFVSGDITNDKLMQAFAKAMNAGGGCCSSKRKK